MRFTLFMCGIFGYTGKKNNAAEIIFDGLKELEYRGYDSWGIAARKSNNKIFLVKKTGPLPNKQPSGFPTSSVAFGHTRWATHGGVTVKNAHPHFDCKKNIVLIHNGIIENYQNIKQKLIKNHHRIVSDTDSELFAHLIEEKIKTNNFYDAVVKSYHQIEGLNAFIIYNNIADEFIAIKNTSPIILGKDKADIYFSSDPNALLPFTNNIYILEDNQIAIIKKQQVDIYDLKTNQPSQANFIKYQQNYQNEKKGKFQHFMLKEISQEPAIIKYLASRQSQISKLSEAIRQSYGAYCIGSGSAAFAALFGTYIFSKISKRHINFSYASEFSYYQDFLTKDSLVIAFSQSGETADVIAAINAAKNSSSQIACVTNVVGSTLYRLSDLRVTLDAGQEKCVMATKSFTAKMVILTVLAMQLNNRKESEIKNLLEKSADELEKIISNHLHHQIKSVARKIAKKNQIFVIGRGANYPLALEGALKIKEGSYVHAEGLAGGELKHGVIALIEKGTPCIVLCPNDETYPDILSNAIELKSRGGYIIGIGNKSSDTFDKFIPIEDIGIGNYILSIGVLQLLGYYIALARHTNPDRPRNLAKSVTVK